MFFQLRRSSLSGTYSIVSTPLLTSAQAGFGQPKPAAMRARFKISAWTACFCGSEGAGAGCACALAKVRRPATMKRPSLDSERTAMGLPDQVAEPCFKAAVASLAVRRRMLAFAEAEHAEHRRARVPGLVRGRSSR